MIGTPQGPRRDLVGVWDPRLKPGSFVVPMGDDELWRVRGGRGEKGGFVTIEKVSNPSLFRAVGAEIWIFDLESILS